MDADAPEPATEIAARWTFTAGMLGASGRGELGPVVLAADASTSASSYQRDDIVLSTAGYDGSLGVGFRPRRFPALTHWFGVHLDHAWVTDGWSSVLAQDDWYTARWFVDAGPIVGLITDLPLGRWFALRGAHTAGIDHMWYRGNSDAHFHELLGAWQAVLGGATAVELRPAASFGVFVGARYQILGWPEHLFGMGAGGEAGLALRL